jgi:hypothetical protein
MQANDITQVDCSGRTMCHRETIAIITVSMVLGKREIMTKTGRDEENEES